jgi:hypothetical protein
MASLGNWTVVFDDKMVIKQTGDNPQGHVINDDSFWGQSKFSNIWAIHYGNSIASDQVEYRDETPHTSYADANLGDFQDFITRYDAAHLAYLQANWDNDTIKIEDPVGSETFRDETEAEKTARLGARPTSYSS